MKKVLCMADSFKGTLSSEEVNRILADTGNRHFPQTEFQCICIADGGEGCVNGFLQAVGGQRLTERVQGPWGGPVDAAFALLPDGKTAVVEMAACAGLPLAGERKNPEQTTTFGVGQLIQAAVSRGARQVLLGLGGSCTHDGGCGMAAWNSSTRRAGGLSQPGRRSAGLPRSVWRAACCGSTACA